ncbi:hypothetical protein AB0B97_22810 [Micromonospora sp. NPDC049004]|uniref:hypothetical protein n=1 Tax=Micromonospora sp. NPDC049004 TaxID=3154348 RepID=UPI0034013DE9
MERTLRMLRTAGTDWSAGGGGREGGDGGARVTGAVDAVRPWRGTGHYDDGPEQRCSGPSS